MKGLRVVRGPDWEWGDTDGGVGHVGTVIDFDEDEKTATVIWDSASSEIKYRAGMNGAFDLLVLDNAQTAVIHPTISCDECEENGIRGLRWKCAVCPNYDLCSSCYHSDKHNMCHKFLRYDTYHGIGPTLLAARGCSQNEKQQSQGIFTGAVVSKGVNWIWNNEDDGDGAIGLVVDIEDWGVTYRSKVQVMWANKTCFNYRVGHQGIVDLTCRLAADGGQYYEGHLPLLGKDTVTSEGPMLPTGYIDQHLHLIEPNISFDVSAVMNILQEYRTTMVEYTIRPGIRVVRGPNWDWDDQDGGEGYVGTVFDIDPSNFANVLWDNGSKFRYRVGYCNNFDLRILDTAPSGVVHKTVLCNSCRCYIQGIRWKCTSCFDFDLCSACYNSDQHDIAHTFWRYYELSENRVLVPCRSKSVKIMSRGIFKDAIVCRGPDWQWGEQDAVIDVVSSSQGTEPSPVDTDSVLLKRKITYAFTDLIQPLDILSVFHKYNLHILTEREIEDIRVETTFKGRFKGAEMLLDKLYKYKGWFQCLLNVLQDEKVKLRDLASSLDKLKHDLLHETVSQASGLQSDHPQPVQTKSYGQGLVLSIKSWYETANCAARVQWDNHSQFEYRVGYMGKVDLKLVKASDGGYYYRDHLPILGKTETEEECEPNTANKCQFSQEELVTDPDMLLKVESLKILMRQAHIESSDEASNEASDESEDDSD
uniref:Uncharacterized protein n=1 Tax=Biomphalaria glabrata TaxID=6526 RepID=A0A2C9JKZ7_BIOGL